MRILTHNILFAVFISLFISSNLQGQKAENILIDKSDLNLNKSASAVCTGTQFAGSLQLGIINAESNDITLNRMFLCRGDEFNVIHNGNAIFDGDPDNTTSPGIGYAWYECPPSPGTSGPDDLSVITSDPCVFDLINAPTLGIFIYTDQQNGNARFRNVPYTQSNGNVESIPEFYNGGSPIEIWFAPITYDRLDVSGQAAFENGSPCVDVNTDAAFSIVYLNPVEVSNVVNNVSGNSLSASFVPTGGVSEFDGTNYSSVSIYKTNQPAVVASSINGIESHGNTITFVVPESGEYTVEVIDAKGCPVLSTIFLGADPLEIGLLGCDQFAIEDLEPGDNICIPFVANNYDSITSLSFGLVWDATVLEFSGVQNFGSVAIDGSTFGTSFPNGITFVAFNYPLATGESLSDGSVLFEVCFDIIGLPNSMTTIQITDFQNTIIEASSVSNSSGIPVELLAPCAITVSQTSNLTGFLNTCGGTPLGNIDFTVIGGDAPYEYDYVNTANGAIFNTNVSFAGASTDFDVPPGNYIVTIRDANGVEVDYNVDVASDLLAIVGSGLSMFMSPTCYDFTNGQITVVAEGGTPPYSYEIADLNNPGLPHYSGYILSDGGTALVPSLAASNYLLVVIDANGCEAFANMDLDANPFVINLLNLTDATCNGQMDGAITIEVSGSTPPYTFDIPDRGQFGIPVNPNGMISVGLFDPGQYEFVIHSSVASCDTTFLFTIGSNTLTSALVTPIGETCGGANDGSVTLEGTTNGSTGDNYLYSIFTEQNAALQLNQPGGPSFPYSPLAPGNYKAVVENVNNGCLSDTLFFTIGTGSSFTVNVDTTTLDNCSTTFATGSATFDISGGVAPLSLSTIPAAGLQNGNTIEQLNGGNYTLVVTDDNLCTATTSFVIQTYEDVADEIISFIVDGTPCSGGTITVVYNGVIPDISNVTVSWAVESTNIPGNMVTIPITTEGNYSVSLIDTDNNCLPNTDTTIMCDDLLDIDIVVTQPQCASSALPGGSTTGSVLIDTSNAVAPVTYYWSVPDTTVNNGFYDNLAAGWYYVTVTDALDSMVVDSFEIISPAPVTFVFGTIDSTSCRDACDGEVDITPSNIDDPFTEFQLFWDANGSMQGDTGFVITADGLCDSMQYFLVTQDGICVYQDSVIIPSPDSVTIDLVDLQDASCFGMQNGSITVVGSGGAGPYSYLWETTDVTESINGLGPDTYTVLVTDGNLCSASDSFTIVQPDSLILTIDSLSSTTLGCDGQGGAIFTFTDGGDDSSYSYNWNPNATDESFAINLGDGNYRMTVTDGNGCMDTTSFLITVPIPIAYTIDTIALPQCSGDDAIITIDTVYGGSGSGYTFNVQNGPNQAIGTPIALTTGQYVLSVSDSTGCSVDTMFTILEPNPIVVIIDPDSVIIDLGVSAELEGLVLDSDNPIISYLWSPSVLLDCDTCQIVNTFNPSDQVFTLTVTDSAGCIGEAQTIVFVNTNRRVFIPNVFTPNNDGRNEIFGVFTGQGVLSINTFQVFDRWGELVYSAENIPIGANGSEGWNGEFNNTPMDPGVYAYVVSVSFVDTQPDGSPIELIYRGDVTLLR